MTTLLEFMTHTKGIEYLLAVTFILAFAVLWMLLHHRGSTLSLMMKILPVVLAMLGIGALATLLISSSRPTSVSSATAPDPHKPLLTPAVLVNMYGPALFGHDLHKRVVSDCKLCHHFSGEKTPACKDCHGQSFDPADLSKPGLMHVYHLRCISCHVENTRGPTDCTDCHTRAAIPPLSAAHPLTAAQKCLHCHGPAGLRGVTRVPPDHASATDNMCQLCHKPMVEATARAVRKIPHELKGMADCLGCHGEGIADSPKTPADHTGRVNETCLLCHAVKGD